jgi:hypothetical protein
MCDFVEEVFFEVKMTFNFSMAISDVERKMRRDLT